MIISQYLGRKDQDAAGESGSQLLMISILFSVAMSAVILVFNEKLMRLMFGRVEDGVMEACLVYLRISAYSYPVLAVYNAGAALYRSFGKTSTTMYISVIANVINVAGNLIGVFVLRAGVAGVAYPSLLARAFSAVIITFLCFSGRNPIQYRGQWIFKWNKDLLRRILYIAVPNGVESGFFQLVKVGLSSIVALFGTSQIAANGIAQSIWGVAALVCVTMGPVFITVIGQCMGAGDIPEAEKYFRKLMTKQLVVRLVLVHNIFNAAAFPYADPLGKGLRAAGDVKFTTLVSLGTTAGVRLVFSILFGVVMNLGVMGIAWAMCLDWVLRGIIFRHRFKQGKWKTCKVI